jgi:hypothetical protein
MAVADNADRLWQENYDARAKYFESAFGRLPRDILKMLNMSGVWPGGGLFVIPAERLGPDLSVYTTFGLSNPDMPTTVRMSGFVVQSDATRPAAWEGRLQRREPAEKPSGAAGYGYEILVIAARGEQWPLGFLQWAVMAEVDKDVGLLARVAQFDGLTIEGIGVAPGLAVNVLIASAEPPLPEGTALPAGSMKLLSAVTITDDEMNWSMKNGRRALLQKLQERGVGQISTLGRPSVVS